MKIKLAILSIFFIGTNCYGQDYTSIGINAIPNYDFKNSRLNTAVSLNSYLWYFNFGGDYRINDRLEPSHKNDVIAFVGIGYFNRYQLQIGRGTSHITYIRQRTDWTLEELGFKWKSDALSNPFQFITVSAFVDKSINDSRQNWVIGIGLGYSIRATGVLH